MQSWVSRAKWDEMRAEDKKRTAHDALVTRILEGEGMAARTQRRAALDNTALDGPLRTLINKVAQHPARITDDDVAAVTASGLSDDQIFELVVCAAVGQATRQYEAALEALTEVTTGTPRSDHAS